MIVAAKFITPIYPTPDAPPYDYTRVGDEFCVIREVNGWLRLGIDKNTSFCGSRPGWARKKCNGVLNFREVEDA